VLAVIVFGVVDGVEGGDDDGDGWEHV